jgi:hypothetical protein
MKLDDNNNQHSHKFYSTKLNVVESAMRRHLLGVPQIKKDLDVLGIEVINANPDSAISTFTRMNFKDIPL